MSDQTRIEWADATLNYANGCSVVSPGCTNCYAMKQAHRFPVRQGLTTKTKGGMVWTGEVRLNEAAMLQALKWKRGRKIFWNAHGDLFHENVPDAAIDRLFAVCALTPQHTHMILTKRSARMLDYFSPTTSFANGDGSFSRGGIVADAARQVGATLRQCRDVKLSGWPLPNVWLGVSVEDQTRADERIPDLLATPAAVRFLSCEPLLGPLDLRKWVQAVHHHPANRDRYSGAMQAIIKAARDHLGGGIDWVITGGESGPKARPMHPDWARFLRDQCAAAGVPFFFKQWGEWMPHPSGELVTIRQFHNQIGYIDRDTGDRKQNTNRHTDETMRRIGKKRAGRLLDGVEHSEFPA